LNALVKNKIPMPLELSPRGTTKCLPKHSTEHNKHWTHNAK